jgi:DNA-directed RNA polymerase subunit H (RpoH/RPB5)
MYNEYLLLSKANGEELNSFALDSVQTIQMYRLINEIIDKAVNRNHRTYNEYDYQKKYNEYRQEQTKPKAEPKPETTGNPKLDKILEKIKLRKEQLTKMKSNDPERAALLNELKTYENVANKMKSKVK